MRSFVLTASPPSSWNLRGSGKPVWQNSSTSNFEHPVKSSSPACTASRIHFKHRCPLIDPQTFFCAALHLDTDVTNGLDGVMAKLSTSRVQNFFEKSLLQGGSSSNALFRLTQAAQRPKCWIAKQNKRTKVTPTHSRTTHNNSALPAFPLEGKTNNVFS